MGDDGKVHIDIDQLRQDFGMSDTEAWKIKDELDPDPTDSPTEPLRGWYITLTYTVKRDDKDCVTEVKGYTSCSQGEFDKEDVQ